MISQQEKIGRAIFNQLAQRNPTNPRRMKATEAADLVFKYQLWNDDGLRASISVNGSKSK